MANPSSKWDQVPIYGVYLKIDDTPSAGQVSFTLNQRITRVDGRMIYAEGAKVTVTIGNTSQQDASIRSSVRAAWRAADQAAAGGGFNGTAWDIWWDTVVVPAAVFTSFPAADDPEIVQKNYSVEVREQLQSGGGKVYSITPLLTHLDLTIPGLNLGLVEVPPGSPSVPAPMYAKGVAGGVAALNYQGEVLNAAGEVVGAEGASTWSELADKPTVFPPSSHTHAQADVTGLTTALSGKAPTSHTHAEADVTGLTSALAGKAAASHSHPSTQITDFTEAVQDAVAAVLAQGTNVTLTYNDAGNSLTIAATGSGGLDAEAVRDAIGIALIGTGVITVTPNDALDTITISSTATANSTDAALRDRSTHTGTQAASTITGLTKASVGLGNVDNTADASKPISADTQAAINLQQPRASAVGYRIWNGSTWSARPSGYLFVEAFSDGTAGSTRDSAAPAPTGASNGDRWWDAAA